MVPFGRSRSVPGLIHGVRAPTGRPLTRDRLVRSPGRPPLADPQSTRHWGADEARSPGEPGVRRLGFVTAAVVGTYEAGGVRGTGTVDTGAGPVGRGTGVGTA